MVDQCRPAAPAVDTPSRAGGKWTPAADLALMTRRAPTHTIHMGAADAGQVFYATFNVFVSDTETVR